VNRAVQSRRVYPPASQTPDRTATERPRARPETLQNPSSPPTPQTNPTLPHPYLRRPPHPAQTLASPLTPPGVSGELAPSRRLRPPPPADAVCLDRKPPSPGCLLPSRSEVKKKTSAFHVAFVRSFLDLLRSMSFSVRSAPFFQVKYSWIFCPAYFHLPGVILMCIVRQLPRGRLGWSPLPSAAVSSYSASCPQLFGLA
jgi:hypothetical protein